jgi:hypothetical protein
VRGEKPVGVAIAIIVTNQVLAAVCAGVLLDLKGLVNRLSASKCNRNDARLQDAQAARDAISVPGAHPPQDREPGQ